jgi:1,4-dihydroxy-2-naphthoyl-CoA hydrolase
MLPNVPIAELNKSNRNTIMEVLGINYTELGDDYVVGTMPVTTKTHQPAGVLHGGASVVLIESLGSMGSFLIANKSGKAAVGIEVNANHLRAVKSGVVTCKAKLVHAGRKTHIWTADITDENDRLICTGRLTTMVIDI